MQNTTKVKVLFTVQKESESNFDMIPLKNFKNLDIFK